MGIKYLLRGIGIGVIITAIVLGGIHIIDAGKDAKTLDTSASGLTTETVTTEDAVIEDSSLRRILEQNQEESTTRQTTELTSEASTEAAGETTEGQQSDPVNGADGEDDDAAVRSPIKIQRGMNGSELATLLEEEGLITSADEFSKYMELNGYDNRLRAGAYRVSSDMTYKELAKLFTARK